MVLFGNLVQVLKVQLSGGRNRGTNLQSDSQVW